MLSALKELDRLYREIEAEVFGGPDSGEGDTATLSDAVRSNRQLLARLEQASARLSESAAHWSARDDRIPREEREQIRRLAHSVRLRASRLLWLQQELGHVRNGARFLRNSRPAKTNYPKFIDSHG
jgi:hypothetical protein